MDANVLNFLISFGAGVGANISSSAIVAAAQKIFSSHPDIEHRLSKPKSSAEFMSAINELAGALEVCAGAGSVSIDGAFITALRSANFDHQNGSVVIGNTRISAPLLQSGGTGAGHTFIGGNTELKSAGTSIRIGGGASITITGNASIRQS